MRLQNELVSTNGFRDLQRVEDITNEMIIRLLELIKRYLETPINQRVAQRFYRVEKSLRGRQLPGISFSRARYLEADLITTFRDDRKFTKHLFELIPQNTVNNTVLATKTITTTQLQQSNYYGQLPILSSVVTTVLSVLPGVTEQSRFAVNGTH